MTTPILDNHARSLLNHFTKLSIKTLLAILLLLTPLLPSYATTLVSTVDRNTMGLNETLTLTVKFDGLIDGSALSFNALQTDFEILTVRPVTNNSMSMVNGKTTRVSTTTWTVILAPKSIGSKVIPAFSINGAQSRPITVSVTNLSTSNTNTIRPLTATLTADHQIIYPGQQLLISIKISAASNVGDLNGSALTLNNADIELLGQNTFSRIDNGVARQIVELKYAVFANTAGDIEIPALTFTGRENPRRSLFGSSGKQVVARTQAMSISVIDKPSGNYAWLPAEKVTIKREWPSDRTTIQVGSPITRKIVITAHGQRATAIPPIDLASDDTYKIYADKPQLHTEAQASGLMATRIESAAIVPNKEGTITLPEVRLHWWNVKQKQWQEAVLPAETLSVMASNTPTVDAQYIDATAPAINRASESQQTVNAGSYWIWPAVSALLLLICLIQSWLLIRGVRLNKPQTEKNARPDPNKLTEKHAWESLQTSLKVSTLTRNDAQTIRSRLLSWASYAYPQNSNVSLSLISNTAESNTLKSALQNLDIYLFGSLKEQKNLNELNVPELRKALSEHRQHLQQARQKSAHNQMHLAALYPS